MRLPWFLIAILFAFFVTDAFARLPSFTPEGCSNRYAEVVVKVHSSPGSFAIPPAPELIPFINSLSGDVKYQARQLMELRIFRAQRGSFLNDEQKNLYEALEWKNRTVGLIAGDTDGKEFWTSFLDLPRTTTSYEREVWIKKFADSKHPDAEMAFYTAYSSEKDPGLKRVLRALLVSRGFSHRIHYDHLVPELRKELLQTMRSPWQTHELMELPEKVLSTLLYDSDPSVAAAAADGFRGRSMTYVAAFLNHENEAVRAGALKAVHWDGTIEMARIFQAMATHASPKVRSAVIEKLKGINEPASNVILKSLALDNNSFVGVQARQALSHYESSWLTEGKFIRRAKQGTIAALDDEHYLEFIHNADLHTALESELYQILDRPLSVRLAALRANDPQVRLALARQLLANTDSLSVGEILLRDPVAQVRALGAGLISNQKNEQRIFKQLMEVADKDEDRLVRDTARKSLAGQMDGYFKVYEPIEYKMDTYLENMRHLYGDETVRERDVLPLAVADNVYKVPETSAGASAETLVVEQRIFEDSAPQGLKISHAVNDPLSGFTGAIYESTIRESDDTIVGIAGTWTGADVLADLNLGTIQAKSRNFSEMIDILVSKTKKKYESMSDRTIRFDLNRIPNIVVTGHSLGGAMSQAFGHQLVKAFEEAGMPEMAQKVRVVGWNGFGGKEALKRMGAYSEKIADDLGKRTTNYYLPNDKVSKIGTHIGEMVPIANLKIGPLDSHKMGSVADAFLKLSSLGENTEKREASKIRTIAVVTKIIGPVFDGVQFLRYKSKEWKLLHTLAEARLQYAAEEGYKNLNPEYDWLKEELETAAARLFGQANREKGRKFLADLEEKRQEIIRVKARAPAPLRNDYLPAASNR